MSDAIIQTLLVCWTVIIVVLMVLKLGIKVSYSADINHTENQPPVPEAPQLTEAQQKELDEYNETAAANHGFVRELQKLFLDDDQITEEAKW